MDSPLNPNTRYLVSFRDRNNSKLIKFGTIKSHSLTVDLFCILMRKDNMIIGIYDRTGKTTIWERI